MYFPISIFNHYFISHNFILQKTFETSMHLMNRLQSDKETQEEKMTFYRFIKLTQKRQLERIWQIKNKIHLRKQIKQQISNKIHIIPTAFAQGLKIYKHPTTLNAHIESSRFPQQLTPTKRMHSEEIVRKKQDQYRMPNLKLLYRRDQLNSLKEKQKNASIHEQMDDRQVKIKRIRLSLPVGIDTKPQILKNRARYGHLSPPSQKHAKMINPQRFLKI